MARRRMATFLAVILSCALHAGAIHAAVESFSTGGHTVYHLRPATVESGKRAIIAAAYDGYVLCHRSDGTPLWQAETGGFFPFDMAVADINFVLDYISLSIHDSDVSEFYRFIIGFKNFIHWVGRSVSGDE